MARHADTWLGRCTLTDVMCDARRRNGQTCSVISTWVSRACAGDELRSILYTPIRRRMPEAIREFGECCVLQRRPTKSEMLSWTFHRRRRITTAAAAAAAAACMERLQRRRSTWQHDAGSHVTWWFIIVIHDSAVCIYESSHHAQSQVTDQPRTQLLKQS